MVDLIIEGLRGELSEEELADPGFLTGARLAAERSVRSGRLTLEESAVFMRRYEKGLDGYTYLEGMDESPA